MFEIDQLANSMESKGEDIIRLTLGKVDPDSDSDMMEYFPDSNKTREIAQSVLPEGLPELKEEIIRKTSIESPTRLTQSNILIGAGTGMLIRNLIQLITKKGDEVLIPHPYYPLYKICTEISDATPVFYSIINKKNGNYSHEILSKVSQNTKIIIINSPGNPMGNVIPQKELDELNCRIPADILILSDEIYHDINFTEETSTFISHFTPTGRVIISRGFSKSYSLYPRRIGYMFLPDKFYYELRNYNEQIQLTCDPISQLIALMALKSDRKVTCDIILQRKELAMKELDIPEIIRPIDSQGGFYLTIKILSHKILRESQSMINLARRILEEKKVATTPGDDFGLPDCLRLSLTHDKSREGISLLNDFFRNKG